MELWIRSQDKNVLQKTNALYIINTNIEVYSIIDNVNMTKYGTYSTKERALEILDEIQKILKPQIILSKPGKIIAETCDGTVYSEPNEYDIKELSVYVYEMPKE